MAYFGGRWAEDGCCGKGGTSCFKRLWMTGLLSPTIVIKILVQFVLLSFMYPGHGVTHQVEHLLVFLHILPGCSLGIALLMLAVVKHM